MGIETEMDLESRDGSRRQRWGWGLEAAGADETQPTNKRALQPVSPGEGGEESAAVKQN